MKKVFLITVCVVLVYMLTGCASISEAMAAAQSAAAVIPSGENITCGEPASVSTVGTTDAAEEGNDPAAEPDGKGVLNFTIVLHLEGWNDGANKKSFTEHAKLLREYAELCEKYGAKMTLEAKEIIDGCINWGDNVLLEMQNRGHAVGIHADTGYSGGRKVTPKQITDTIVEMKTKLSMLDIDARFVSGVASKADWVTASVDAGMEAVTCMVDYGLWSLDPALRPAEFKPYDSPSAGHGPYPDDIEDRVTPWTAKDGSMWINNDPSGSLVIIPHGLSLTNAFEEYFGNEAAVKSDFTADDIRAWRKALPEVLAATDSGQVNTFYAVWSFGQALDKELLEDWLKLIDGYVQKGQICWTAVPDMIDIYKASL